MEPSNLGEALMRFDSLNLSHIVRSSVEHAVKLRLMASRSRKISERRRLMEEADKSFDVALDYLNRGMLSSYRPNKWLDSIDAVLDVEYLSASRRR